MEQEGGRENVNRTPPLPYFPSSLLLSTQICLGALASCYMLYTGIGSAGIYELVGIVQYIEYIVYIVYIVYILY